VNLEQQLGPEEDVEKSEKQQGGEAREERTTEVEILAVGGVEGSPGEAGEHHRGQHEGGGHDGRVQVDGHVKQRAHAEAGEECESKEHGEPGGAVLAVVWRHEESEGQADTEQREHEAAAPEDVSEEMDVRTARGGQHGHGQARVHVLQVGTDVRIELVVECVDETIQCRSCHIAS